MNVFNILSDSIGFYRLKSGSIGKYRESWELGWAANQHLSARLRKKNLRSNGPHQADRREEQRREAGEAAAEAIRPGSERQQVTEGRRAEGESTSNREPDHIPNLSIPFQKSSKGPSKVHLTVKQGVIKAELDNFLQRELAEDGYAGVDLWGGLINSGHPIINISATKTMQVIGVSLAGAT